MRLRICQPTGTDGVPPQHFHVGSVYDFDSQLAGVFLTNGWAEPAEGDEIASNVFPDRTSALVLVIDDDTDVRELTATVLSYNGYGVIQAEHGHEALNLLSRLTPDLIVLDLNMPVMDGWQFRAEQQRPMNARLATIPVLLVTGADNAEEHAETLKVAGLIKKPFDPQSLLVAVEAALRQSA